MKKKSTLPLSLKAKSMLRGVNRIWEVTRDVNAQAPPQMHTRSQNHLILIRSPIICMRLKVWKALQLTMVFKLLPVKESPRELVKNYKRKKKSNRAGIGLGIWFFLTRSPVNSDIKIPVLASPWDVLHPGSGLGSFDLRLTTRMRLSTLGSSLASKEKRSGFGKPVYKTRPFHCQLSWQSCLVYTEAGPLSIESVCSFLIEISITGHKTHHFQVLSSVVFSIFT